MQAAERTLIPYRLRAVRVGIQCTILVLAVLLVFRLLPGSGSIHWTTLVGLCSIALAGTALAVLLPWQTLFEGPWGLRLLYAWSVADILLISFSLGITGLHNPSLFLLYTFTTIFFAASYPARSQLALYLFTVVSYLTVISATGWHESPADTFFRLGALGAMAFVASFMSHELMHQMTKAAEGRIETEDEKRFYESLLQAQSDMEEGLSVVDLTTQRFTYVNDAACRIYGYSREELLGLESFMQLIPPEEFEYVEGLRVVRMKGSGKVEYHQDFRVKRKDDRVITVEVVSEPIDDVHVVNLIRDVTAQREAEEALRERQELLQAASEMTSGFVYSVNVRPDGSLAGDWVTDAFTRITGYPVTEARIGEGWIDLVHPDDVPAATQAVVDLYRGADFVRVPLRIVREDGEVRHIETYAKAVWDQGHGRVIRMHGMVQDITEQKQVELALRERGDVLRAISELSSDFAYSFFIAADGSLSWDWVTDAFERVTGYSPEEASAAGGWMDLLHRDDLPRGIKLFDEVLDNPDRSVETEFRLVRKSGEVRDISVRARTAWDPQEGRAVRMFGSVEDITESKQAEAALRASEERYRNLFDRLPIGLFLRTPDGDGLDANAACVRMFGYPDKETYLATNARALYVQHQDRIDWLSLLDTEGLAPRVMEFRRWDESTFWGRVTARSIRVDDGTVAFLEGAIENISHEREIEQEREQSFSLLRAALESTWDGLLVVDLEGRIVTFNERFAQMWDVPRKVLDERDDAEALAGVLEKVKDPDEFLERVMHLYENPEEESFDTIEFLDGRVFERSSIPQRIDDRIVGRVWSFRDLTDRRRLEQQLLQAQKMEAVGRLAGGIAHDFNNLLTAMLGYCELVLSAPETPKTTREDVKEIEQAAQMGAEIAAQLLDLSRRRVLRPEVLDINEIVRSMAPMLRRLSGPTTVLETRLSDQPCMIEADRSQIEQIILNLVVNARDALMDGGEIGIDTKSIEISDELAAKSLRLSPGRHALLSVSDTGHGIDPEIKDHIFEPFFTTRAGRRGTGLGLSTIYGIVTHNKGHIAVESEPGRGSSFRIYLPESIREPIPMARARAATKWLSGEETVLLVEDDEGVRRIARRALEKYGYSIIEASSGGEAVRLVLATDRVIDLLITDVIMRGMDGRKLAEKLRPERPDLRVLYMSGYTGEALARFGELGSHEDFIAKPFRPDELIAKVRDLLNRRAKRITG